MSQELTDLKAKIRALANKKSLTADEAGDLEKYLNDAKALQLQAAGIAFTEPEPTNEPDPIDARISKALEPILKAMEKIPGLDNSGFITNTGGTADPKHKSFGDFLMAIRRKDYKRLTGVYGSAKTLEEDGGTSGGYLVPQDFRTDLLQMAAMTSRVVPLCRRIPVSVDAGSWPALDQFTAPTAGVGDTAFSAGAKLAVVAESGTLGNNEPSLTDIQWRTNKVGDLVYVSNELNSDSPVSIEALLRSLFGIAIAAKEEYFVLRGTGVGMPLGVLNAACAIGVATVTNNVFAYMDALNLISRFKPYGGTGRFVMHQSVVPDLGTWEIGTAGAGTANLRDLGYGDPIFSEHMPQANNDDVLLADFSAYLLFDRQALTIDMSEHAAFTTDRVTWRFKERIDGQPWLKSVVTLADPQGSYTVSPFCYHDD
jgi:HK97 family phage major capsid protein